VSAEGNLDVLVVGSGVAGCTVALELAALGMRRIGLVTKGHLGVSNTDWAQGGIAAALSAEDDSIALHFEDTLRAGGGLCDIDATRVLVGDGPDAIRSLEARGAVLDRDERGELARSREGGHSVPRVVHAGGMATGAEVIRALVAAIEKSSVQVFEHEAVVDLAIENGRCVGVLTIDAKGIRHERAAGCVVLATGGFGQLFAETTNPDGATGDGVALAIRAGVAVADLEFVQFHPTALDVGRAPRPLLSEGLRGYGALLLDSDHKRFVDELAPRDVVSRAIVARMREEGSEHVYLDARAIEDFSRRFPTLAAILTGAGLDAARDLLPVAPAAHYVCGGIVTDLAGRSSLPALLAVGEVACTGAEGANRLASNSLLEGLVFARRAARAIVAGEEVPRPEGAMTGILDPLVAEIPVRAISRGSFVITPSASASGGDVAGARATLQRSMTERAGVVRDAAGLTSLADCIRAAIEAAGAGTAEALALRNLATVAASLAAGALARRETRGAHSRTDFPDRDEARFRARLRVVEDWRANARA
jgi:L-aspartate oxidase